jgi:hypothetical protein
MADLSALELELLRCAAQADKVRRPVADLHVGDKVVIRPSGRTAPFKTTITTIGPVWITTGTGHGVMKFRRTTLRTDDGLGVGTRLYTLEQDAYDQRIGAARERLLAAGVSNVLAITLSDGRVLALAALFDVMDADTL